MCDALEAVADSAPADFAADTAVNPGDSPGSYTATIPDEWRVIYAFGGVTMAVALRALTAELARDDLDIVSANAVFVSPVPCGPVEMTARVLRSGRGAAQGHVVLTVPGVSTPALMATATFGDRRDTPITYSDHLFPPAAGRPEDHEPPPEPTDDDPFPEVPYHRQTDWRPAIGARWWEDEPHWEPGPARFASWHRLLVEPWIRADDETAGLDPLALCVPGDMIGGAIGQRLGPNDQTHFFTITLELGMQWFAPATSAWILQDQRTPHVADGYAWGSVDLFDGNHAQVAAATQRARLRFFSPDDNLFDTAP